MKKRAYLSLPFLLHFISLGSAEYLPILSAGERKTKTEVFFIRIFCVKKQSKEMEKALTKVGGFWISKKAKEELSNITGELSAVSNTVEEKAKWILNKLKGKHVKPLADVLREHNLPRGLFPRNITCYEMDESKSKLSVYMPAACEVRFKDGSAVRYGRRVKGTLSKGKLSGMEGMKTKVVVWVKVTGVSAESCKSDKVWFMASGVKKSRPRDAYELPHDSVRVEEI